MVIAIREEPSPKRMKRREERTEGRGALRKSLDDEPVAFFAVTRTNFRCSDALILPVHVVRLFFCAITVSRFFNTNATKKNTI